TEREGTAAGERQQKNLQSAIAADFVERRPLLQRGGRDRACQGSQRMHDELGWAAGAGGGQYPFGFAARGTGRLQWLQRQAAWRGKGHRDRRRVVVVMDQRIGLRL